MPLDESVHGTTEKCRGAVVLAVPGSVLFRTLQSKIGSKVDYLSTSIEEPRHDSLTFSVRQGQKDNVNFAAQQLIHRGEDERGILGRQSGHVVAHSPSDVR
jgi:hypothetical protein